MADYTKPTRVTYTKSVTDGTAATWPINPPPGTSKGRVADINATVTTTFTSTSMTVPAKIGVGVAGNTMIAGQLSFGTAGAGASSSLALGWASPVAGVASVQSTNATPFNKTTNSGGAALVGTTSALTTGSNNPVVAVLETTGASNTIAAQANGLYPPSAEVLGPVLITYVSATGGAGAGAATVDITIDWF